MWNSAARAQRGGRTLKNKNISRKEALWQCLESLHAVPLNFVYLSYYYISPLSFVFISLSQWIGVVFTSRLTLFLSLFLRCLLDRSTACGRSCWRGSGSRSCTWRKGKTYGTLIRADNVFTTCGYFWSNEKDEIMYAFSEGEATKALQWKSFNLKRESRFKPVRHARERT